jgi:hypothetical protein
MKVKEYQDLSKKPFNPKPSKASDTKKKKSPEKQTRKEIYEDAEFREIERGNEGINNE